MADCSCIHAEFEGLDVASCLQVLSQIASGMRLTFCTARTRIVSLRFLHRPKMRDSKRKKAATSDSSGGMQFELYWMAPTLPKTASFGSQVIKSWSTP